MIVREFFRACFTPVVMIGTILIAGALLVITLLFVGWARPGPIPDEPGTAVVKVIQSPTETPQPVTATSSFLATLQPSDVEIEKGSNVKIIGTGGVGLRLRYSAGLNSNVRLLGAEGEIFQVMDGPEQVDNYTWWYLENPQDRSRKGWAVANFLELVLIP
jgi:hypothetical protein